MKKVGVSFFGHFSMKTISRFSLNSEALIFASLHYKVNKGDEIQKFSQSCCGVYDA